MSRNSLELRKSTPFLAAIFTVTALWALSGSEAAAQTDQDTLDLSGDWTLTMGFSPGLTVDATPAHHWIPVAIATVYPVHFDFEEATEHGMKYLGYYVGCGGHPLGQPGALVAETFYDNRGVQVVQILEQAMAFNYFCVRSGKHQRYPVDDPTRIEVLGGWVDIGGNNGNFSLVKTSP